MRCVGLACSARAYTGCLLALALSLAWSPGAQADIYECKRAGGELHYTNRRGKEKGCKLLVKAKTPRATKRARALKTPQHFAPVIREAASTFDLPPALIEAVMRVESAFQPEAVSPKGATGLMQLMPATAKAMGVRNIHSPRENVLGGARYLRLMLNRFDGDLVLALAAYNAGEHAVESYGGVPPYEETQRYVRKVIDRYVTLRTGTQRQAVPASKAKLEVVPLEAQALADSSAQTP